MALKDYFLRQISVVNYRLPLIEFEIFICRPALFPHEATTEDENSRITIPKINMMMSKAE